MSLTKQIIFKGIDDRGNILCQPLFGDGLEKTASPEMRSKLHPKIQDFVRAVRPTPSGIYVLVNALGAGEYWGSNVNGDLFPEKALIHSPPDWDGLSVEDQRQIGTDWDYGYPTFMGAYPYKHHVNKNPSRAFGRVELATWNPVMHRVELVVYLDRALCKQFDGYDIIERVENGEFPDVSMGCKVPFDVCTICENPSKTRNDYCEHALRMMNKILPDGRKVAVRNDKPKFFDISFVFIGADKTAKVMAKLASKGNQVCMGDFCTIPRLSADVGEKYSSTQKSHPTTPISRRLERLYERRPDLLQEKTANDPIKKKVKFQGIDVHLEWLKDENRQYKKGGKVTFERLMKADYGYIPETKDKDGEELDVYLGPSEKAPTSFLIEQKKDDGSFDEHKLMLGYSSEEGAKKSYLAHMPQKRLGKIYELPVRAIQAMFGIQKTASVCDCRGLGDDCGGSLEKLALALFPSSPTKSASHRKVSELIKDIPAGPFTKETLPRVEKTERDIPNDVLDLMGGLPLGEATSTPGMAGIVLKPREFQRMILVHMGEKPLANELDQKGQTFGHTEEIDDSIPVREGLVNQPLLNLLAALGLLPDRSLAGSALKKRSRPQKTSEVPDAVASQPLGSESDPLMKKLAAAYNGYRRNLIKKAGSLEQYLVTDSLLRSELFGQSMAEAFAGGVEKTANVSVLSPDSLAYLVGAHYRDRDFHLSSKEVVASLAQTGGLAEASA